MYVNRDEAKEKYWLRECQEAAEATVVAVSVALVSSLLRMRC